jgi:hypothetical protein
MNSSTSNSPEIQRASSNEIVNCSHSIISSFDDQDVSTWNLNNVAKGNSTDIKDNSDNFDSVECSDSIDYRLPEYNESTQYKNGYSEVTLSKLQNSNIITNLNVSNLSSKLNDSDTEESSDDSDIELLEVTRTNSFEKLIDVDGLKHKKTGSSPINSIEERLLKSPTTSIILTEKTNLINQFKYIDTNKNRVKFCDTFITNLELFCQKQPILHPTKALQPEIKILLNLTQDYFQGKEKSPKIDRQPFYNSITSYKDYLESKLKFTWIDTVHSFLINLLLPIDEHREIIRFPLSCDAVQSVGKIVNLTIATSEYPIITTRRLMPNYSFVILIPKESIVGK